MKRLHSQNQVENYQVSLVSALIFEYKKWELSQKSSSYQGIYSMAAPYKSHMKVHAEAEAYIESGQPIPKRLSSYARKVEAIEAE